jgi:hypothetical protein
MAMTTKLPSAATKSKLTAAKKTASTKPASTKAGASKAGSAKVTSAKASAHILPAAKGPRTVSHRQIKEAVDKVFRERAHARA